jgi:hypothetical protein
LSGLERIWTCRFTEFAKFVTGIAISTTFCASPGRDQIREFRVDLSQKGIDPRVKSGAHVALSHACCTEVGILTVAR